MQLEKGVIVEGEVTGITKFGAFVSLPDNKSGLIHISEISNTFVKDINDVLKLGQKIRVKVVDISENGKIALSAKQVESFANKTEKTEKEKKPKTFEDMMTAFKQQSDEKFSDLRRSGDSRYTNNKRNGTNRK